MTYADLGAIRLLYDQPRLAVLPDPDSKARRALVEVQSLGKRADGEVGEIWHGMARIYDVL